jgi:undecaprenyl phosphate-alpha-L-ara4N flippase subunit ArnE
MTLKAILLLALAIIMEVAREMCFKLSANQALSAKKQSSYLFGMISSPLVWLGFACWGVGITSWVMVLEHLPLSIAFPIMSLSYCGMIIGSKYVLGETISAKKWLGIILITIGVVIIGSHGGE